MYYHLILTDACNLCCSYCRARDFQEMDPCGREVAVDEDVPPDLSLDLSDLYRFLSEDPSPTLTFYGGEPSLRPDLIEEVMGHAPPACRFMVQTNGLLLDRLGPDLVNRFSTILVSVDGPAALTDAHRGAGVYARVMKNVRAIRAGGYAGELIARMTVAEDTDIEEAVLHLAGLPDCDSVHWQIDANFWGDYSGRDFAAWMAESYNPGIRRLVGRWVAAMRDEGRVPRWYPFLGCMEDLLLGQGSRLRCGCGYANYTIMTDGTVIPCPCMVGMKDWYLGHISSTVPHDLPVVHVGTPCTSCSLRSFCGGRCLYSNILLPWPEEGRRLVCRTVQNLHDALTAALPEVRGLIAEGRIAVSDFSYERFNGCEIIP
ncbi:TIGR04084 family radical SAM/SPASM domain-containing protein [Methanofollis ethanolicus]|uniref:TIGR04084 family radical SAM/SPASM domain-containing protein n=1 Tax=Methanofollis ethanolicus TaxID=488124 RepID=UPI00082B89C1|nr:TIGR04084 family radical SAM/SPASM domain-containing protein [Methanofollis ethanolicus]